MPATHLRFLANLKGAHKRKMLEGRPHLVVSAAILGEAVITGAGAGGEPLLYTNEEIEKSTSRWNHMPVVVYHPEDETGFVSARTPAWLDARKVGVLLNTKFDGKLKTQCWFDEARTKQVDRRVYDAILANTALEVSTGLGAELDRTPGEYNGVPYKGSPKNFQPDHLAILPDKVGAYSIEMGGGLFVNQLTKQPESVSQALIRAAAESLTPLGVLLLNNELSFSDKTMALSEQLAGRFGERGKYWGGYVCEVYESHVIFSDGNGKRWKIGYSTKGEAPVLDRGDPVEVVRAVVYRTTDGKLIGNQAPNPPQETDMADRKTRIDSLIANSKATEADRPHLTALSDAVFNAAFPEAAAPPSPPPVTQANTAGPASLEDWKKTAPPEVVQMFNQGEKARKQRVDLLVNTITKKPDGTANPACKFSETALRNMDVDDLAALAELAKASYGPAAPPAGAPRFVDGFDPNGVHDYSGAAGAAVLANQGVEVPKEGLKAPKMEFKNRFAGKN